MKRSHQDLPAEFDVVVDRLLAHRAELTPLELDRIKHESRSRAAGAPRMNLKRENTTVMKTRTSILAVLASGILLSGTGAALGVSGLADSDSAGNAQYNVVTPQNQGGANGGSGQGGPVVLGETESNAGSGGGTSPSGAGEAGEVQGATGVSPTAVAQPGAQQSLDADDELPFTGWAAIPVLLLGLALLGAGMVMRRRTLNDHS